MSINLWINISTQIKINGLSRIKEFFMSHDQQLEACRPAAAIPCYAQPAPAFKPGEISWQGRSINAPEAPSLSNDQRQIIDFLRNNGFLLLANDYTQKSLQANETEREFTNLPPDDSRIKAPNQFKQLHKQMLALQDAEIAQQKAYEDLVGWDTKENTKILNAAAVSLELDQQAASLEQQKIAMTADIEHIEAYTTGILSYCKQLQELPQNLSK
jgi:hypothetical protein